MAIIAGLKNEGHTGYAPKAASLVLGIDSEMLSYPRWNYSYFPTLLRCEKTHFWGYLMTPYGRIMTVGSPDPVASYSMNYELSSWGDGGHLIYTCSLDLMHALPLPARHPQNLVCSSRRRAELDDLSPTGRIARRNQAVVGGLPLAPMIDADRYTLGSGESSSLTFWAPKPITVTVGAEDGSATSLPVHSVAGGRFESTLTPQGGPGLYKVTAAQSDGHISERTSPATALVRICAEHARTLWLISNTRRAILNSG